MTNEKSQKDMISFISKQKSQLTNNINLIVNGSIDAQKLSIDSMVIVANCFKNKVILTNPKELGHTALIDYFKKDCCSSILGMTWEYFTKSTINKKDLVKLPSGEQQQAIDNKIYKVGTLKGRTFLNFLKGGFVLNHLDALYRKEPDKSGQLLIKMDAVRKLKGKKQQTFWDSKINNTDYAFFSYNDMIRAYLTMFGVSRESGSDKSKSYQLIQDLINTINSYEDFDKYLSEHYDIFQPDETKNNQSKVFQVIDLLLNAVSERAEQHTKGQGGKNKYDIISDKLFVEYKQIKTNLEQYEPQRIVK
jgi:hypothetical protein